MKFIRRTIQAKADFDIDELNPIDHVDKTFIPSYFIAATEDNFIMPHHTQQLYQKYAGDKNLNMVEGDHNSPRPQHFMDSVGIFFYNTLQCENLPQFKPQGGKKVPRRIMDLQ